MTYTEQIEQYVAVYPETTTVFVPLSCGVTDLPAFTHVVVQMWGEEFCELIDAESKEIARFRLVG